MQCAVETDSARVCAAQVSIKNKLVVAEEHLFSVLLGLKY